MPTCRLLIVAALLAASLPASLAQEEAAPALIVIKGTPLVRLRYVAGWLGAEIGYEASTRSITFILRGHTVRLKLNSTSASIDGNALTLVAAPMERDDHTYVPLAFMDRTLRVPIEWNPETGVARLMHPDSNRFLTLRDGAPPGEAASTPSASGPLDASWLKVTGTAQLPASASISTLVLSDDLAHWAYVEKSDAGQRVVDDRNQSPGTYRLCRPPFFVSGTDRLAYWAIPKRGNAVLIVDGEVIPTVSKRPGMLVFSPNGMSWATASWGGDTRRPESRFATVMLDGAEVGRYWDVGVPCFSPDSAHLAFLAVDAATQNLVQVVDGEAVEVSDAPALQVRYKVGPNLTFQTDLEYASDGTIFTVFHARRGWEVRAGSRPLARYAMSKHNLGDTLAAAGPVPLGHIVYPSSLVVAGDAPVAAWWGRGERNSPWTCCLRGRNVPATTESSPADDRIVISPDGKRVAFRVRHYEGKGEERHLAAESVSIDGKVGGKYEWIESIGFSPDSRRYAYRARRVGAWRDMYVIDGEAAGPDGREVFLLCFSPDGEHYAYASQHDSRGFIVCDGIEYSVPWFDITTLSITSPGKVTLTALADLSLITATGTTP